MTVSLRMRKLALTAHVAASVGWLGAVVGFLALALAGVASTNDERVRAAYLMMELTGWFVLVPLAVASLLTGLVQSMVSSWGLFRHYWVVAKLLMSVFATLVLLAYMQTLRDLADVAGETSPSPVLHAAAALVLLLVATTLAVYKPRGLTPYGQRKQHDRRRIS